MVEVILRPDDIHVLLESASGDAVKLYLFLRSGCPPHTAGGVLRLSASRLDSAVLELRRLCLLPADYAIPASGGAPVEYHPENAPVYSDGELAEKLEEPDGGFSRLRGEFQRRYGRTLSNRDLHSLLTMTDYLKLPGEVVGMLLSYCIERDRLRGKLRLPAIQRVEQEAYVWRARGIDTMRKAADFTQQQLQLHRQVGRVAELLEIRDRRLTDGEFRSILGWLEMGFGGEEIKHAFDLAHEAKRRWGYANTVLTNWHNAGLHTLAQIEAAEAESAQRPSGKQAQRNAQYERHGQISDMGYDDIQRLLNRRKNDGLQ